VDNYRDPKELLRLVMTVHKLVEGKPLHLWDGRKAQSMSSFSRASAEFPDAFRDGDAVALLDALARFAISIHENFNTSPSTSFGVVECLMGEAASLAKFQAAQSGRDAMVRRGIAACIAIHRYLGLWNCEHGLGWEQQVHSRIALSTGSWTGALLLLQQAQRDETVLDPTDWALLSAQETLLLRAAGNIRPGATPDAWEEFDVDFDTVLASEEIDPRSRSVSQDRCATLVERRTSLPGVRSD